MKYYIIATLIAFLLGVVMTFALALAIRHTRRVRNKLLSSATTQTERKKALKKAEFSKLVLALVLMTYFLGVFIGVYATVLDISQLGVLLAYIGTPTTVAIGFYAWKAKAENVVKIKREYSKETEGIPVDLNNVGGNQY